MKSLCCFRGALFLFGKSRRTITRRRLWTRSEFPFLPLFISIYEFAESRDSTRAAEQKTSKRTPSITEMRHGRCKSAHRNEKKYRVFSLLIDFFRCTIVLASCLNIWMSEIDLSARFRRICSLQTKWHFTFFTLAVARHIFQEKKYAERSAFQNKIKWTKNKKQNEEEEEKNVIRPYQFCVRKQTWKRDRTIDNGNGNEYMTKLW